MLCVIVLPAWLLVSRAPEFRIVPPEAGPEPESAPAPAKPDDTTAAG